MSIRVETIIRLVRVFLPFLVSLATGLAVWQRKRSARHWPMIYGRVEIVTVCDEENRWFGDLSYSYTVGSEYYSGTFRLPAKNEDDADTQAARWRGQSVIVRYSPKNPAVSILRMEDQPSFPGVALRSGGEFQGV